MEDKENTGSGAPAGTGEPDRTRRNVLNVLLGTGFVAWISAIIFPVIKFLSPLKEAGGGDEVVLGDKEKKDVEGAGFTIVRLGTERILVFRDRTQKIRATTAKCTHEGCTVQYKADESIIWCACHNGRFDLEGRVISGPPPRALVSYKVAGTLTTKVVVSREGA